MSRWPGFDRPWPRLASTPTARWHPAKDTVEAIAACLGQGRVPPPLILVGRSPTDPLVVLEGHTRLTEYAFAPDTLPPSWR
jgi:hypothetical protein